MHYLTCLFKYYRLIHVRLIAVYMISLVFCSCGSSFRTVHLDPNPELYSYLSKINTIRIYNKTGSRYAEFAITNRLKNTNLNINEIKNRPTNNKDTSPYLDIEINERHALGTGICYSLSSSFPCYNPTAYTVGFWSEISIYDMDHKLLCSDDIGFAPCAPSSITKDSFNPKDDQYYVSSYASERFDNLFERSNILKLLNILVNHHHRSDKKPYIPILLENGELSTM